MAAAEAADHHGMDGQVAAAAAQADDQIQAGRKAELPPAHLLTS